MRTGDKTVSQLRHELNFLDRGGYRVHTSWRPPLFFQDSPICTKQSDHSCPNTCALVSFVPTEYRDEAVPCRHIPLNAAGETFTLCTRQQRWKKSKRRSAFGCSGSLDSLNLRHCRRQAQRTKKPLKVSCSIEVQFGREVLHAL